MTSSVSLIISTRNRADSLRACLASMTRLPPGGWELIVVDDGSTDSTRQVLEAFSREATMPFKAFHEPAEGVSRARNRGAEMAHGEILAFTDDDCYPDPQLLDEIRRAFEDPRLGFVGGRVLLHDPDDLPVTIQLSNKRVHYPSRSFILPGIIQGANMAIRKVAFDQVHGFDPLLGPGTPVISGEDVELLGRLSAAGWDGAYDPGPVVYHHHRRRGRESLRTLLEGYAIGRGSYYAKLMTLPGMRRAALRNWWRYTDLRRHKRRFALELKGALLFTWLHLFRRHT